MTWTLSQPSDMGVPPPFLGVAPLNQASYLAVGRASAAYTIGGERLFFPSVGQ